VCSVAQKESSDQQLDHCAVLCELAIALLKKVIKTSAGKQ
jgi:hypothetical protein